MPNLAKKAYVFGRDFERSFLGSYSAAGEKDDIRANFYDIKKEEEDVILNASRELNHVLNGSDILRDGISLEQFEQALENTRRLIRSIPDDIARKTCVVQESDGRFSFGVQVELKEKYQSRSANKMKP